MRLTVSMAAMFEPGELIKKLAGVAKDLLRSTVFKLVDQDDAKS